MSVLTELLADAEALVAKLRAEVEKELNPEPPVSDGSGVQTTSDLNG